MNICPASHQCQPKHDCCSLSEIVCVTDLMLKQRTFCIWFKLIYGKFIISAYLFHYSSHLTYVLILNILGKKPSSLFFIRVVVCSKCQNNVQCSVISNCFLQSIFAKGKPQEKNEGTFSDQSGDTMYAFIHFTKYKSNC